MGEPFQLYVKNTSNCAGLPLQTFERLGPEWTGESLRLPFGEGAEIQTLEVVGWTDLYLGSPCPVHVARVRWLPHDRPDISGGPAKAQEGYLVWGGNSGIRILDDNAEPTPGVDDHLPAGYGRPGRIRFSMIGRTGRSTWPGWRRRPWPRSWTGAKWWRPGN